MAKKAKWGYRMDGKPKRKPGPKKSGYKKKKRSSTAVRRKIKSGAHCLYGRTASGACRRTPPYRIRGGTLGRAIYASPAGPMRESGVY